MFVPLAATVKEPLAADAEPARAGLPRSRLVHGAGRVVVVVPGPAVI
jgi:hypothetical protein